MGTSCACNYVILFFDCYERTILLQKYKRNLLFYKKMMIYLVYGYMTLLNPNKWELFKNALDNVCQLKWTHTNICRSVDFLDITIVIGSNWNISTKTLQKKMNLSLYIPPHFAHTPGLMKTLVYGILKTYYIQNTCPREFSSYDWCVYYSNDY